MRGQRDYQRVFPLVLPVCDQFHWRLSRGVCTARWQEAVLPRAGQALGRLQGHSELRRNRGDAEEVLLRRPSLGHAQEVDEVVLLVPVHDSVHFVAAVGQRENLLAVDVHVHQVLEVARWTVAQRRNGDVGAHI